MTQDQMRNLPANTIYNLTEQLLHMLEARYAILRRGTTYNSVRLSDIRVFVQVARQPRGETDVARSMNVSRQAVQSSVKRLVAMGVVEVVPMPNNRRNKIVQLTEQGQTARATAAEQIKIVEGECAEIIGADELERLRGLLLHLTTGYKSNHFANGLKLPPQATGV